MAVTTWGRGSYEARRGAHAFRCEGPPPHPRGARTVLLGTLFALAVLLFAAPAGAAPFLVNNAGNGADANPGDGACATAGAVCTLRAAIQEANALAGADTISFNIAGLGPHTITPTAISLLTVTSQVTIDATTEPDYVTLGYPAIEINGASAGAGASGITLAAGSGTSIVRGLAINRFTVAGILINNSNGNTIERCHLGTNPQGTADLGNTQYGIQMLNGASNNFVGGVLGTSGNVISGNDINGVDMINATTTNNRVIGNIIGLGLDGTTAIGNTLVGVGIGLGSNANIVGQVGTGRNIISGNGQHGVRIVDGNTSNNVIQNNYIGLNLLGTLDRGNGDTSLGDGIRLETNPVAATGNVIGGVGLGNVISGNNSAGIHVRDLMNNTTIQGNIIGRNAANSAAIANGGIGIRVVSNAASTTNVTIGGLNAGEGNVAAANGGAGIALSGNGAFMPTGCSILRNSTFSNAGLGIDLGSNGSTANDPGDADAGANALRTSRSQRGHDERRWKRELRGLAEQRRRHDVQGRVLREHHRDATGDGEGQRYLGFTTF